MRLDRTKREKVGRQDCALSCVAQVKGKRVQAGSAISQPWTVEEMERVSDFSLIFTATRVAAVTVKRTKRALLLTFKVHLHAAQVCTGRN